MRLVVIESPLAGDVEGNIAYAKACLVDSLSRGEAPFASHLLYAQDGALNDLIPQDREIGMTAGFAWGDVAEARVVYIDRGVSNGMLRAIRRSEERGQSIEYRTLRQDNLPSAALEPRDVHPCTTSQQESEPSTTLEPKQRGA